MKRLFLCVMVCVFVSFLYAKEKLPYAIYGLVNEDEETGSNQKTLELSLCHFQKYSG